MLAIAHVVAVAAVPLIVPSSEGDVITVDVGDRAGRPSALAGAIDFPELTQLHAQENFHQELARSSHDLIDDPLGGTGRLVLGEQFPHELLARVREDRLAALGITSFARLFRDLLRQRLDRLRDPTVGFLFSWLPRDGVILFAHQFHIGVFAPKFHCMGGGGFSGGTGTGCGGSRIGGGSSGSSGSAGGFPGGFGLPGCCARRYAPFSPSAGIARSLTPFDQSSDSPTIEYGTILPPLPTESGKTTGICLRSPYLAPMA